MEVPTITQYIRDVDGSTVITDLENEDAWLEGASVELEEWR